MKHEIYQFFHDFMIFSWFWASNGLIRSRSSPLTWLWLVLERMTTFWPVLTQSAAVVIEQLCKVWIVFEKCSHSGVLRTLLINTVLTSFDSFDSFRPVWPKGNTEMTVLTVVSLAMSHLLHLRIQVAESGTLITGNHEIHEKLEILINHNLTLSDWRETSLMIRFWPINTVLTLNTGFGTSDLILNRNKHGKVVNFVIFDENRGTNPRTKPWF